MSDSITSVEVPSGSLLLRGHLESEDAIDRYRQYLEAERDKIAAQLKDLEDGMAQVYHQRGMWKARNKREVLDD